MPKKSKGSIVALICLIILLLWINYPLLDDILKGVINEDELAPVSRVIDGDTIEVVIEEQVVDVRLLGINTPERGERLYAEAKAYLESLVLNKTVTLVFTGPREDKYGRTLAYVFLGETNVNSKLVENGFANYYFYSSKDRYSEDLLLVWQTCMQNNKNLCERSNDACFHFECIEIQGSSIVNDCLYACNVENWTIKGEGRETFTFKDSSLEPQESAPFTLNLDNTGGSLFLRDDEGKLVVWESG